MKLRKVLLSVALTIAMVVTLLPAMASAESEWHLDVIPNSVEIGAGQSDITIFANCWHDSSGPADADITWTSGDEDIVVVEYDEENSSYCTLTGLKPGETTISATAEVDGDEKGTAEVPVKVTTYWVTLEDEEYNSPAVIEIGPDETADFTANCWYYDKDEKETVMVESTPVFTWSSDNEEVATVTADPNNPEKGTITGLSEGEANIMATALVEGETVAAQMRVVVQRQISSIAFSPKETYTLVTGIDGDFAYDDDGQEYFCYKPSFQNGDTLYVTYAGDDQPTTYVYSDKLVEDESIYAGFVNSAEGQSDDIIEADQVHFLSNQTASWDEEQDPILFYVEYRSYTTEGDPFTVTIEENPVKEIAYTPKTAYEIPEGMCALREKDKQGNIWFDYQLTELFQEGDKFTVNPGMDDEVVYTYSADEEGDYDFRTATGEVLDEEEFRWDSTQQYDHWVLQEEQDYFFTVYYNGCSCSVPVKIVENPVASIRFAPAKPITLEEGADGQQDEKGYWYYRKDYDEFFRDGDVLTITYANGGPTAYTYDGGCFTDESQNELEREDFELEFNEDGPWSYGENKAALWYRGKMCEVPVTAIANSVKSISYLPGGKSDPVELREGVDGYIRGDVDEEWFEYEYSCREGDKLIVTDTEGQDTVYVYTFISSFEGSAFISASGDKLQYCDVDIEQYDNDEQSYNNQWLYGDGKNHAFRVAYHGVETGIPVTIVENPVTSIEFEPKTDYELVEELDGFWDEVEGTPVFGYFVPSFQTGDKLTVNGETVYVYNEASRKFESSDTEVEDIDEKDVSLVTDQWGFIYDEGDGIWHCDPWTVGNTYQDTLHYSGCETSVDVKIIPYDESKHGDKKAAKEALEQAYETAIGLANEEAYKYTPASMLVLNEAVENAEIVLNNNSTKQQYVDAKNEIETAIEGLVLTEEAQARIEAATRAAALLATLIDIDEADYTEDSYQAFASAKQALEDTVEDEFATAAQINSAIEALEAAKDNLERTGAAEEKAKEDAQAAIEAAGKLDPSIYTAESFAAVTSAKDALAALLADTESETDSIVAATTALNDAIEALEFTPEEKERQQEAAAKQEATREANAEMSKANALKASDYTPASVAGVDKARQALAAVLAKTDATSQEIKDATKALTEALGKLVRKFANPLKVTSANKKFKVKKLRKKKQAYKALTVSGAQGAVSYTVKPANKKSKKALKFSTSTGKITVKKKTKKGTYKMIVTVRAAGNDNYFASGAITKTITVKVK